MYSIFGGDGRPYRRTKEWKDVKLEHACLDDDSIFGHFRTNGKFGNIQCAPEFDVEAIYGHMLKYAEYGNSEIRILLYKQPPNCAHTMTYVSTYSRHKK